MAERDQTDYLLALIAAQLDAIAQQLNDGYDVAPARSAQLEGLTAACLAAGMAVEVLLQFCRQHLPANAAVYLNNNGDTLQFELWQCRAPVYPTTKEHPTTSE